MKPLAQVQWIATVLLAGSTAAICQSTMPPMAPTMREMEEHPAMVEYSDGRIAVVADNSSLNEILRDVARRAGMSVKGSVLDERVFGTYGPAAPAEVLSALLKGTDSNMMVVAGSSHAPELILTPKQGGPTPPNLKAAEEGKTELAQSKVVADNRAQSGGISEGPPNADDEKAAAPDDAERKGDMAGASPTPASGNKSAKPEANGSISESSDQAQITK